MIKFNLVFDIGANIGKSADIFKNVSNKVICFEANPNLVKKLNGKFNNSNVIVDPRGVSNQSGKQIFNISSTNTISTFSDDWINNSRFKGATLWDNKQEVETTTLNSIIDQYGIPDYIKIDIEGYEYEVLTSFTRLLDNTLFAFEWAEEQKIKIEAILKHLHNLGYNKFGSTEGDEILFDENIQWKSFDQFDLINGLDETRKTRWGMIYFKQISL